MSTPVTLERRGRIALIVLDNPPVNALSQPVRAGLLAALEQLLADPDLAAAVIMGRGRTFIAGADITEFGKPPQSPSLSEMLLAFDASPKPLIAAIHGMALGGGLETALCCHYRCAVPQARLGLPEVKLGLVPGAGGTQRLPRLIGAERALEMMVGGEPVGAHFAKDWGLIDELIDGELEEGALGCAERLIERGMPLRRVRDMSVPGIGVDPKQFITSGKRIAVQARGLDAPIRIVRCVEAALNLPFDEGIKVERQLFEECMRSNQSAALRHLFFAEREVARVPGLPKDTATRPIARVGIIGAGTMGSGIAVSCLAAGFEVTLVETQAPALERGRARIRTLLEALVKKGRATPAQLEERFGRLSTALELPALEQSDLVIEAVFENMTLKREIFAKLDRLVKPGAILATNTSTLDVDRIAQATGRPQDVAGLHFFSPANVMRLIEIVRGSATADDVIASALAFARRLEKTGVVVGNCFGFVGNRMLYAYGRENQLLVLEGAEPERVDRALQEFGMAMGPNAVSDLAGLDVGYKARREHPNPPDDPRWFRVSDLMVENGRLGQKTGTGIFRYSKESRAPMPDPAAMELIRAEARRLGIAQRQIDDEEIVERCISALINEGAYLLGEGIALRALDIDVIWANGYGFPRFRGGPMFHANTLGLDQVLKTIRQLADRHGDRYWKPAPLLERLAAERGKFS